MLRGLRREGSDVALREGARKDMMPVGRGVPSHSRSSWCGVDCKGSTEAPGVLRRWLHHDTYPAQGGLGGGGGG